MGLVTVSALIKFSVFSVQVSEDRSQRSEVRGKKVRGWEVVKAKRNP
jgi:hypothetical protein